MKYVSIVPTNRDLECCTAMEGRGKSAKQIFTEWAQESSIAGIEFNSKCWLEFCPGKRFHSDTLGQKETSTLFKHFLCWKSQPRAKDIFDPKRKSTFFPMQLHSRPEQCGQSQVQDADARLGPHLRNLLLHERQQPRQLRRRLPVPPRHHQHQRHQEVAGRVPRSHHMQLEQVRCRFIFYSKFKQPKNSSFQDPLLEHYESLFQLERENEASSHALLGQ